MKMFSVVVLVVMVSLMSVACGGGSDGGSTLGIEVDSGESMEVDSNSYLPLTAGIVTEFSDGLTGEYSTITVENLFVKVLDGGIIRIEGRKITEQGAVYGDYTEEIKLRESNGQILLIEYSMQITYPSGDTFSNRRIYNPPVVLLQDKTALAVGDIYETENVDVEYEEDPEEVTFFYADSDGGITSGETVQISDLYDVMAKVEVRSQDTITIGDYEAEVYTVKLIFDIATKKLWFPMGGLSVGTFGLAKGIGIVSVAGRDAISTNAIE